MKAIFKIQMIIGVVMGMVCLLAADEGARLAQLTGKHPADLSRILHQLVHNKQLLTLAGRGRGAVYHLKGLDLPHPDDVFGKVTSSPLNGGSSPLNGGSSPLNDGSSPLNGGSSTYKEAELLRDRQGRVVSNYHSEPLIDSLEHLMPEKLREIEAIAQLPRKKQRISREQMRSVIRKICSEQYVTLGALAALVNRKPKPLQAQYLSPMVKEKQLNLAFPATPNHPQQAYITAQTMPNDLGKEKS